MGASGTWTTREDSTGEFEVQGKLTDASAFKLEGGGIGETTSDVVSTSGVVAVNINLRWRTTIKSWHLPGGGLKKLVIPQSPTPNWEDSYLYTEGLWATGGSALVSKSWSKCNSPYINPNHYIVTYRKQYTDPQVGAAWLAVVGNFSYAFTIASPEIDWGNFFTQLKTGYDPASYQLLDLFFYDAGTATRYDIDKINGWADREELRNMYSSGDSTNSSIRLLKDVPDFKFKKQTLTDANFGTLGKSTGESLAGFSVGRVGEYGNNPVFVAAVEAQDQLTPAVGTCYSAGDYFTLPMVVRAVLKGGSSPIYPPQTIAVSETSEDPNPLDADDSAAGNSVDSDSGSPAGGGLGSVQAFYGNSIIPFDSVFLSGANYNLFVSGGGGIVCETGFYPNGETLHIDKIKLDVEGSYMSVVQTGDFDGTTLINVGDKIYGYIFNEDGDTKPSFGGWVISKSRQLNGSSEEIVYECRDLKYFLNQLVTTSHVKYKPGTSLDSETVSVYRIVKTVLMTSGLTNAVVDLPDFNAPAVEWNYEPINNVLEWACKFFGKYAFYVNKSGILNVGATDAGIEIKSFRVPSRGESVGTNKVLEFTPIEDTSRSRSRVILTGDYEITEKSITLNYTLNTTEVKPEDCTTSGLYWFNATNAETGITSTYYYFMFRPGETLNSRLISDKSVIAKIYESWTSGVSTTYAQSQSVGNAVSLGSVEFWRKHEAQEITQSRTELGNSFIYIENPDFSSAGVHTFEITYAVRSDSPIQVVVDTGYWGGVEVIKKSEFKKVTSFSGNVDDTVLMAVYANKIKDFYRPIYGGNLVIDGLDTDLYLLGKLSITNTSLPAAEADDLIIWAIEYDVPNKKTTVELSNRVFSGLPYFDTYRERVREKTELLLKLEILERESLYGQA